MVKILIMNTIFNEKISQNFQKSVKIKDVCAQFGVQLIRKHEIRKFKDWYYLTRIEGMLFAKKYPIFGFDINIDRVDELLYGLDSTLENYVNSCNEFCDQAKLMIMGFSQRLIIWTCFSVTFAFL